MNRLAVLVSAGIFAALSAHAQQGWTQPNGNWWLSASDKQRLHFMDGDGDCYVNDVKADYPNESPYQLRHIVTEWYLTGTASRETPILSVIRQLPITPLTDAQIERNKNAEHHDGPHGYYDGEFWWIMFERTSRHAYVMGYISCRVAYMNSSASQPVDYYVDALSQHFGTKDDDPDELKESAVNDAIGDVLVNMLNDKE